MWITEVVCMNTEHYQFPTENDLDWIQNSIQRHTSLANQALKRRGWKGLVAHVQNEKETGLVEYRKLRGI